MAHRKITLINVSTFAMSVNKQIRHEVLHVLQANILR